MSKPPVSLENPFIAVLASYGRDPELLESIVKDAGVRTQICASAEELCRVFDESIIAILVTEEVLLRTSEGIQKCLAAQPAWSDVPVIILSGARGRMGAPERWRFFRQFGNVMVLDRPLARHTLMISLEAVSRARAWQYVVRDQMKKLEGYNADLKRQVEERTLALQAEINERKRVEAALNESRRLEAIGRLAGGVAHDFNNLLQVISASCTLLPHMKDNPERAKEILDTIGRATERGSKLTHQLLAFGRRQALAPGFVDISRHLMEMEALLQQSLREKITLEMRLPDDLWPAQADATHLEVALLNLTMNAKDAMPEGGTVTLEARNIRLPTPLIPEASDLEGEFVWISIGDTGHGMPTEVAEQAFEPFFTTKRIGQGSGLGLSQVYGFARQSGGSAWIRSSAAGTEVSILLPRGKVEQEEKSTPQQRLPDGAERLCDAHLLYVEDDPSIGELTVALLESFGCHAHWVCSADDALQTDLQAYDLVFSDVQMPGSMDGVALAQEIGQRRPEMPVLLASGYVVEPERVRNLPVKILEKPYSADRLRRALIDQLR